MTRPFVYGSVCSGYCAATLAWKPLGWTPKFFAEIEKFPSAVLAHHYGSNMPGEPLSKNGIPNHGDFTKIPADAGPVDLLVGGTPCQAFSVAGKRLGLDDPRGNLALEFLALARRLGVKWILWENVPGVLSSRSDDGTHDFATFLDFVRQCGYGFAYRVLDAQHVRVGGYPFAVPQRRRRVFVVGYLGDWRRAAAVLFDRESLRGDPAPRREAGQEIAPTIASRPTGGGGLGTDFDLDGGLIANSGDVSYCLTVNGACSCDAETETETETMIAHSLRGEGFDASEDGTGRGTPIVPVAPPIASTLTRGANSAGKGGDAGRRQDDESNLVAEPMVLMERGRDGAPSLEYRQDGTANAILTPNGGRGGFGVGAIAHPLTAGMAASASRMPHEQGTLISEPVSFGAQMSVPKIDVGVNQTLQANNPMAVAYGFEERVRGDDGRGYDRAPHFTEGLGPTIGTVKPPSVAHAIQAGALRENPDAGPEGVGVQEGLSYTLEARAEVQAVQTAWAVRRLTPTECERLQGVPDGFTLIPWRGKAAENCPDGPRYKALENSMAVNVMALIGERIDAVQKLIDGGRI